MALECNIDERGRKFRSRLGTLLVALGLGFESALLISRVGHHVLWPVSAGFIIGGVFSIFEARMGWCAFRALGFRTKI